MGRNRAKTRVSKINKHDVHKKKQQRTLYATGSFLVILMVLSVFGVTLGANSDSSSSNQKDGFTFLISGDESDAYWNVSKTPKGKEEFKGTVFRYTPQNLGGSYFVSDPNETLDLISNATFVYVTIDPAILDLEFVEIFDNITNETVLDGIEGPNFNQSVQIFSYQYSVRNQFVNFLNKVTIPLTGVETYSPAVPESVITCNNATADVPVISFTQNNETAEGISKDGNCIFINSENPVNQYAYTDYLSYELMVR